MATADNLKSTFFYSSRQAEAYPLVVPDATEYSIYKENIEYGCARVSGKVTILEIGCGTGRYFHFLKNVKRLVGVDSSAAMLERARENLKSMPGLEHRTLLVQSSFEEFAPQEKFDFIYSIGTLGEYCSFEADLLNHMVGLLKPQGFLFFTIVDSESYAPHVKLSVKRRFLYLLKRLPVVVWVRFLKRHLSTEDFKHLFMSQKDLELALGQCSMKIRWETTKATDWKHTHHICKVWLD